MVKIHLHPCISHKTTKDISINIYRLIHKATKKLKKNKIKTAGDVKNNGMSR